MFDSKDVKSKEFESSRSLPLVLKMLVRPVPVKMRGHPSHAFDAYDLGAGGIG